MTILFLSESTMEDQDCRKVHHTVRSWSTVNYRGWWWTCKYDSIAHSKKVLVPITISKQKKKNNYTKLQHKFVSQGILIHHPPWRSTIRATKKKNLLLIGMLISWFITLYTWVVYSPKPTQPTRFFFPLLIGLTKTFPRFWCFSVVSPPFGALVLQFPIPKSSPRKHVVFLQKNAGNGKFVGKVRVKNPENVGEAGNVGEM